MYIFQRTSAEPLALAHRTLVKKHCTIDILTDYTIKEDGYFHIKHIKHNLIHKPRHSIKTHKNHKNMIIKPVDKGGMITETKKQMASGLKTVMFDRGWAGSAS